MQSPSGIWRVWYGGGCIWDAGYTVEPSGDVVGFNQRNVDEGRCPPDDSNDIPYPPFHHLSFSPLHTDCYCQEFPTKGIEPSSPISFTDFLEENPVNVLKVQLTTRERPCDSMERQLTGGNRPQRGCYGLATHSSRLRHPIRAQESP